MMDSLIPSPPQEGLWPDYTPARKHQYRGFTYIELDAGLATGVT